MPGPTLCPLSQRLLATIQADDSPQRDLPLEDLLEESGASELQDAVCELDQHRRQETNLYQRVRTLYFLGAICRYHLPPLLAGETNGPIPASVQNHLLDRRFPEAIDQLLLEVREHGWRDGLVSALGQAFFQLGLQNLADQVRRSVRQVRGNQWMFRCGHVDSYPLRLHPELLRRPEHAPFPVLRESTAVRMDLSHSAWSDFFSSAWIFPRVRGCSTSRWTWPWRVATPLRSRRFRPACE
jgi:hypothetical protein